MDSVVSLLIFIIAAWLEIYLKNGIIDIFILILTTFILIIIPLYLIGFFSKGENEIFRFLSILERGKYIF